MLTGIRGEPWHRLRQEDFEQVDLDSSPELFELIKNMMRTNPRERVSAEAVSEHAVVKRARAAMERVRGDAGAVFSASPLASVRDGFLDEILGRRGDGDGSGVMDVSCTRSDGLPWGSYRPVESR